MNGDDEFTGAESAYPDRLISPGRPISPGRLISPGRPISPGRLISPGRPISPGRSLEDRLISPGRPISPGRLISPGRPISPGRAAELGDLRDPGGWSEAVSILFVERSALLRLGARLTVDDGGVRALGTDPTKPPTWGGSAGEIIGTSVGVGEHRLGWTLPVEANWLRDALENPELVGALLEDIADGLALAADTAFLNGGGDAPAGLNKILGAAQHVSPAADVLGTTRAMLRQVRADADMRSPGWILHPTRLDDLGGTTSPAGPADSTLLLQGDGADGGILLGYPYVASRAAVDSRGDPAMFFAADWREAWIAATSEVVRVLVSAAEAAANQTQIRVSARLNLALRRPESFVVSP